MGSKGFFPQEIVYLLIYVMKIKNYTTNYLQIYTIIYKIYFWVFEIIETKNK
jgi:hypothetical protein